MPTKSGEPRVTMRMLAERLGVTKTTVSLALRGHRSVSESTRGKVMKLAREMNYRPDPAVAAIAACRWNRGCQDRHRVIAFLCNREPYQGIDQEGYLRAARARARDFGYKVEPFNIDNYPTAEAATRVLDARGIRGLLVPQIQNPDSKRLLNLDWRKFTAVCCGIGRVRPPLHTVSNNMFINTRVLWELAFDSGFKRIGAALNLHNPVAADDWSRLGASFAAEEVLGIPEERRVPPMLAPFEDHDAVYEWYCKYKPDVIVGFTESIAEALTSRGVRFPEDVQLVLLLTRANSPWTGFVQPLELLARHAVDLLVSELRENNWGPPAQPRFTLVTPEWNVGNTFIHSAEKLKELLDSHIPLNRWR